jgi:hypothetical protein
MHTVSSEFSMIEMVINVNGKIKTVTVVKFLVIPLCSTLSLQQSHFELFPKSFFIALGLILIQFCSEVGSGSGQNGLDPPILVLAITFNFSSKKSMVFLVILCAILS